MEEAAPGALIARKYRLVRRIGSGGMGTVWIARNETTHAEVALKMWRGGDERVATAERFRHEARLAALVTHRNIVQIFDLVDEEDGTLALAMELLRGEPLDKYAARHGKKLPPAQAVAAILPILAALAHSHRLGVVHRDVKPSNIFLSLDTDGALVPKLVDFGAAKAPAKSTSLTIDGHALGTPRYMAPEQIRGSAELDGRADLFSVGCTLVELLTGASPFAAPTAAGTLAAVLEREVDPDPRIPPMLWVEIARALAKRPFERHANAAELGDALKRASGASDAELAEALAQIAPSSEATPSMMPPSGETELSVGYVPIPQHRPRWIGLGAGALAVVVTVGAVLALRGSSASPASRDPRAAASEGASGAITVEPADTGERAPAEPPTGRAASAPNAPIVAATVTAVVPRAPRPRPARVDAGAPQQKRVATSPGF